MRKLLRGPRRLYALVGVLSAATAVAVGLTVSLGGAADQPSVEIGASANPAHAKASGAVAKIDISSLPQLAAGEAADNPEVLRPLSPLLGKPTSSEGAAPAANQVIPDAPAGDAGVATPGGGSLGWDGMSNSGTICSYFGSGGCQPPDHGVASNGVTAVQVVNTSLAEYNARTGALLVGYPKSLQAFFGVPAPLPAGCDSTHGNQPFLSDPRAFLDPVSGRFVVAALQIEGAFGLSPACTFLSKYWVAVSATTDPNGVWNVYQFNTANIFTGANNAADYTQLGFNQEAIFISGNQFNQPGSAYVGAWVLAIPKATAEAGGAIGSISGFKGFTANDGTATRVPDTVQPVASYGAPKGGPAGEILVSSFNESINESKVVVWDFSNALAVGGAQTISGVVVPTLTYAQVAGGLGCANPNGCADNPPSCHDCLESIDTRVSATPVYMHGNAYFTHDSLVNNGQFTNVNVLFGAIHPVLTQPSVGCTRCSTITAATSVVDQGYITYGGERDSWFGVIQPDREGNLFIAYEYSAFTAPVTPPSAVYIAKRATATGFPDSGILLRTATVATTNSRWGDYEAVAFENWNSNGILFATEFTGANGNWSTRLSRVGYSTLAQR